MFRNANNNFFAFVCNHTATDANAIAGTSLEVGDLVDGDVVLVDKDNNILADSNQTGVSGLTFKIATRAGGKLFYSPLVTYADCTVTTGNRAAAAQQVTTIGSDGTTAAGIIGSVAINDDTNALAEVGNSFYCLIEKQDNDEANRSGYAPAITAQVKFSNPAGFTAAEYLHIRLAEQLREAIRVNDQLEASTPSVRGPKYVRPEVLVVDGTTKTTVGAVTLTLTHGSNVVTSSGTLAAMAAGSYLILGEDVYRTATATNGSSDTTVTLDFPYAGSTTTMSGGATTSTAGFITEANLADLTGVGLRLTGQAQHDFDVNRERKWSVSRFNVRFAKDGENAGAAIATGTAASEGLGEYQQVAFEEYESFGALGQRWVSDTPATFKDANTETDSVYGLISLREVTTKQNSLIGQTLGKTTYHLWIELESGVVDGANSCQDVLLTQLNISASAVQ